MSVRHLVALARYNWPLYAVMVVAVLVGGLIGVWGPSPLFRIGGGVMALVAGWYAVASLWAFHLMFDRSVLLSGIWLKELVPESPRRCVQLSVCLEETTLPLDQVFPLAEQTTLDLFQPQVMTEPAVTRAREASSRKPAISVRVDDLPVEPESSDMIVVTLAAHEVRDPKLREAFFQEIRRITRPSGTVIVIEHLRNLAALLAFGPGWFHFYPRSEWLRLAKLGNMKVRAERPITPFVHVFVMTPQAPDERGR